ncbi:LOW QUALITY PROTEIN: hypothetical protein V2J09_022884 [Rumex salicifolius]
MNCLSWNCRGADKGGFIRTIKYISGHYRVDLLALMETKISGSQATETLKARFPNSKRVEAQGFKGGLWLLWDDNVVDIQVITKADYFIRARARKGNLLAKFCFVYGPPTVHRQRWFWTDL